METNCNKIFRPEKKIFDYDRDMDHTLMMQYINEFSSRYDFYIDDAIYK